MITEQLHRWSFLGPLLILATSMVNCSSVDGAPLPNKGPGANSGNPQVMCVDERITVKAKSVSLDTVLDSIAKACGLKILSASGEKTDTLINADIADVTLADALKELLRGCDYLVVYNEPSKNTGFLASVAKARSKANHYDVMTEVEDEPDWKKEQKQANFLRHQIEILTDRIASGASDQFFQEAIKTKPPEFVEDDRKMLASYQERLASLEQE